MTNAMRCGHCGRPTLRGTGLIPVVFCTVCDHTLCVSCETEFVRAFVQAAHDVAQAQRRGGASGPEGARCD